MKQTWLVLTLFLLAGTNAFGEEKIPSGRKLVSIEAVPKSIELVNQFDYRQILLTGTLDNGEKLDVTRMAKLEQSPDIIDVTERGFVTPKKDGNGSLKFSLSGKTVELPVTVMGQKDKFSVSFVQNIMPIMSKMGCNAGTCHGAQKGKNGFRLSLRGYDPLFDHRALTDDIAGRRFNRSAPDRSLMLLKPTNEVPHVGGALTQPGERYYEMIRSWIKDGVKLDLSSPRVKSIEIFPQDPVIPLPEMKQQMRVIATYTDGFTRDVTAEAFINSSNNEIAKADDKGLVKAIRRGETAVLARYEGAYAATQLIVMGDRSGFAWKEVPKYNYIDNLVYDKLKQVKVLPSEVCTDSEFVRRLYLDLTGLPPSPKQVLTFLNDKRESQAKREALVDQLIGSPEFVDHWTNKWADLLQVNAKFLGMEGAREFRKWIRDKVEKNTPYNEFAYQILTASGSNMKNPPASYWKILRTPQEAMENTTHLFLAVRFNCNKCHDHPFERWTQDQYYHLAAYFAQVGRKADPKYKGRKIGGTAVMRAAPLVEIIFDKNSGDVKHDRTGELAEPTFPFTHEGMPKEEQNRRELLAKWITSKENPYFAKSFVNRIWSYMLGVGLIEPVDDIRAGNPPTNPKLLKRLTEEFVNSGFDVREIMRDICKSRTYQHSIKANKWNNDDHVNYSHALARRLPAEVLYDAIHRVSGSQSRLPGLPPGARAVELVLESKQLPEFLKLLGRPPRESACECERSNSMLLGPVLKLINGPVISNALADNNNRINKLAVSDKSDTEVVQELFLAILNRKPSPAELKVGVKVLQGNEKEYKAMAAKRKDLETQLRNYEKQLNDKQPAWETKMAKMAQWHVLEPQELNATGGSTLKKLEDNSVLASGKNPTPEIYEFTATTDLMGISGVRLEVLPDSSLPKKGPGRADNGNFVLNEFKLSVVPNEGKAKPRNIAFGRSLADFQQRGFDVRRAVDNNNGTGWAISNQFGKRHVAVFETRGRVGFLKGTKLTFRLEQRHNGKKHNIGRFRISVTTMNPPLQLQLIPQNIAKIFEVPADKRSPQQKNTLRNYYRSLDNNLPTLQQALNEYPVPPNARGIGAQDLAWALMNTRSFLFNR